MVEYCLIFMNYFYDFMIGVSLGHSGCKITNNQDIARNEKFIAKG